MNPPFPEELSRIRSALESPLGKLDLDRLGAHNKSYAVTYDSNRFDSFIATEWPYYAQVLKWYRENVPKGSTVLEIGTFIPVVPLLLTWEGYRVTTVEKLSLYGDALDPMIDLLRGHNVDFRDADIMDSAFSPGQFDAVNLLAVVEHLLGSPKQLLLRVQGMLKPNAALVFTVPNQARLVRRLGLMFGGMSVQPAFADYFASEYPFSGHHREYTFAEVKHALASTDFSVETLTSIKYPAKGSLGQRLVTQLANTLPGTFHQAIFAIGRRR